MRRSKSKIQTSANNQFHDTDLDRFIIQEFSSVDSETDSETRDGEIRVE